MVFAIDIILILFGKFNKSCVEFFVLGILLLLFFLKLFTAWEILLFWFCRTSQLFLNFSSLLSFDFINILFRLLNITFLWFNLFSLLILEFNNIFFYMMKIIIYSSVCFFIFIIFNRDIFTIWSIIQFTIVGITNKLFIFNWYIIYMINI